MDPLDEADLVEEPVEQFRRWLEEALGRLGNVAIEMAVATVSTDGVPSCRMLLLRGCDSRGFSFFTDRRSDKGAQLAVNANVALVFRWPPHRQVRVTGIATPASREEVELYWRSRPRGSQLAAWASCQSHPVRDRQALEDKVDGYRRKFAGGEVPCPPFWGGYLVVPSSFEFWQEGRDRLHDRLRYRRSDGGWSIERLAP